MVIVLTRYTLIYDKVIGTVVCTAPQPTNTYSNTTGLLSYTSFSQPEFGLSGYWLHAVTAVVVALARIPTDALDSFPDQYRRVASAPVQIQTGDARRGETTTRRLRSYSDIRIV